MLTAVAEIVGRYFPYILAGGGVAPVADPCGAVSGSIAWLLTLYPVAADRVYAAFGASYVSVSLLRYEL